MMRGILKGYYLALFIFMSRQQTQTDSTPAWNYASCSHTNGYYTNPNDHVTRLKAEYKSAGIVSLLVKSQDYVPDKYDCNDDDINLAYN